MNILERADQDILRYQEYLSAAEKVRLLVLELPSDITELDASVDTNYMGGIKLTFYTDLLEAREVLRKHGLRTWKRSFASYNGSYSLNCDAEVNGVTVSAELVGIDKPSDCVVEMVESTVIRYKSICVKEETDDN